MSVKRVTEIRKMLNNLKQQIIPYVLNATTPVCSLFIYFCIISHSIHSHLFFLCLSLKKHLFTKRNISNNFPLTWKNQHKIFFLYRFADFSLVDTSQRFLSIAHRVYATHFLLFSSGVFLSSFFFFVFLCLV